MASTSEVLATGSTARMVTAIRRTWGKGRSRNGYRYRRVRCSRGTGRSGL